MKGVPTGIAYELIRGGKWGRLTAPLVFETPVKGFSLMACEPGNCFTLELFGRLTLAPLDGLGFEWDFGSYAVDTPPMVIASAAHDAICRATDAGLLPWSCRAIADRFFLDCLKANGCSGFSYMRRYLGVRGYSKFVAYHKRKPFQPLSEEDKPL